MADALHVIVPDGAPVVPARNEFDTSSSRPEIKASEALANETSEPRVTSAKIQPSSKASDEPMAAEDFAAKLRSEGSARYHSSHPFNLAMHEGSLEREQLQLWVLNRYYYQSRIPIKDAIIVSKSEDPAFRRQWLRRITDHDGGSDPSDPNYQPGGLERWLRLGDALGVDRDRMVSMKEVLPGVRFACDAYVNFVRESTLLEAVASSLTEVFASDLMSQRVAAFEKHYAFVRPEALEYFRERVPRAQRDSTEAIDYVVANAVTRQQQDACIRALLTKSQILWHLLDCVNFETVSTPKIETEVS